MSFTGTVKDEVSKLDISNTVKLSELAGIICSFPYNDKKITLHTENNSVARRIFMLFKDLYNIYPKITVRKGYNYSKKLIYILEIKQSISGVLKSLGLDKKGIQTFIIDDDELARAFLRGIFMMCGSINDPKTSRYHLEFNLENEAKAKFVSDLLNNYNLNSKVLHRSSKYMVYIKEAEKIGDFLRMINASNAVLYYEDIRIYRDHKNMTNRLNNCEQANVDRLIETAQNQVKDIELIEKECGLDLLDEKEQIAAKYRLKYKEVSLSELAEIISLETEHKITKSGIYHRFHKIKLFAEKLRKKAK